MLSVLCFQEEGGIRDAQECRGLGDVYEGQMWHGQPFALPGFGSRKFVLETSDLTGVSGSLPAGEQKNFLYNADFKRGGTHGGVDFHGR